MKPTTPQQYALTPEFFARTKARLDRRKADLLDLLKGMKEIRKQIQEIDEQVASLAADEQLTADMAARYADLPKLPKIRADTSKRPTPSRPVPSGRPWTEDEDALILLREDGEELSRHIGRKKSAIAKRRRVLRGRPIEVHKVAATEVVALPEPAETVAAVADIQQSSSEKPEFLEPTTEPESLRSPGDPKSVSLQELAEADARRARLPPAKPGIPVTGRLIGNGPGDERVYDYPEAYTSRDPV